MTAREAAAMLGISINTVPPLVGRGQLRPESGTWTHNWTFTEVEVERRIAERDANNDARRRWNGCRPKVAR